MLAIRLKRTGRSGHAQFRVIVQDSRAHPKRGKVVAYVGSYDPHTKKAQLKSEEITKFLSGGAQPSDRVAKLLKKEGVKLPSWVKISPDKKRPIRNIEKLRRNTPVDKKTAPAPVSESSEPTTEESKDSASEEPKTTPKAEEPDPGDEAKDEEIESTEPESEATEEGSAKKPESVDEPAPQSEAKSE